MSTIISGDLLQAVNFQDVTADEFHSIMEVLAWTRLGSTVTGQQELVDITIEQAELNVPFKHTNIEQWNRLVQCIKHALPYFSVSHKATFHNSKEIFGNFLCYISVSDRFFQVCILYLRSSFTTIVDDCCP